MIQVIFKPVGLRDETAEASHVATCVSCDEFRIIKKDANDFFTLITVTDVPEYSADKVTRWHKVEKKIDVTEVYLSSGAIVCSWETEKNFYLYETSALIDDIG